MLLSNARGLNMPAACWGRPYPSLFWSAYFVPQRFEYGPHSGCHGKYSTRRFSLATRYEQYSVSSIPPRHVFPLKAKTLLRSHPGVREYGRNRGEWLRSSGKISSFLIRRNNTFAVAFSWEYINFWC